MYKHKILIYNFHELFIILDEIKNFLNLDVKKLSNIQDLKNINSNSQKNLIVSKDKISEDFDSLLLNEFPVKITNLVERFNIEYLKQKFNQQSEIKIGKYNINFNSREIILGNKNLKLTKKKQILLFIYQSLISQKK